METLPEQSALERLVKHVPGSIQGASAATFIVGICDLLYGLSERDMNHMVYGLSLTIGSRITYKVADKYTDDHRKL